MVYLTFINKLDIPVFNSIVTIILSNPWIRFIFRIFKWRKWMLLTSMWLISVIYHMHYILLHLYYGIAFSGNQRQCIKQRQQLKANAGNTWHSTGQFLNMFQHVLFVFFMEIGSSKRTPFTNIMCQAGSLTKHVKLSMAKSSMTNYDILGPKYDSLWPKPELHMSKLRFYVTLRKNHDFLWPNHGSLRKFPEISKDACFHLHNQAIGVTSGQW